DHPSFLDFLAGRVAVALEGLDVTARIGAAVVFSAHSLPTRALPEGTLRCKTCDLCPYSCRYVRQLQETADGVNARLGLADYTIAWQSAGRRGPRPGPGGSAWWELGSEGFRRPTPGCRRARRTCRSRSRYSRQAAGPGGSSTRSSWTVCRSRREPTPSWSESRGRSSCARSSGSRTRWSS